MTALDELAAAVRDLDNCVWAMQQPVIEDDTILRAIARIAVERISTLLDAEN